MGRHQPHVQPKQRNRLTGAEKCGAIREGDHRFETDWPTRVAGLDGETEVFRP